MKKLISAFAVTASLASPVFAEEAGQRLTLDAPSLQPFWANATCVRKTVSEFLNDRPTGLIDSSNFIGGYTERYGRFVEYNVGLETRDGEQVLVDSINHSFAMQLLDQGENEPYSYSQYTGFNLNSDLGTSGFHTEAYDQNADSVAPVYDSERSVQDINSALRLCGAMS